MIVKEYIGYIIYRDFLQKVGVDIMALEKRSKNPDSKPNKWRIRVTRNGHRHETMFFGNKKEALQAEKDFIYQIDKGLLETNDDMLFKDLYELVIEQYVKFKCKSTTLDRYETTYNVHLKNSFGDVPIRKIKPIDIQKWVNDLSLNYKPSTVKTLTSVLQSVLKFGERWEYLAISPYRGINLPTNKTTSHKEIIPLDTLYELIHAYYNEPPSYHKLAFFIAISCGLRNSEIRGLTLEDINLKENTITINKQASSSKRDKGNIIDPKTPESERTIYLPSSLIPVIKEHLAHVPIHISGGLFTSPTTGKPIAKNTLNCGFKRFLMANSFPLLKFHDLRHLHATILINKGVNIQSVSSRLGHAKVDTTLNVYSHTINEYDKLAAEDFNSILNQSKFLP